MSTTDQQQYFSIELKHANHFIIVASPTLGAINDIASGQLQVTSQYVQCTTASYGNCTLLAWSFTYSTRVW